MVACTKISQILFNHKSCFQESKNFISISRLDTGFSNFNCSAKMKRKKYKNLLQIKIVLLLKFKDSLDPLFLLNETLNSIK